MTDSATPDTASTAQGLPAARRRMSRARFAALTTPAGLQRRATLLRRRVFMAVVNIGTLAALLGLAGLALSGDGLSWLDVGILVTIALSAPWTILGFWNAAVGLWLSRVARNPIARVCPAWRERDTSGPITAQTALLMTIRNEDVDRVYRRLAAMRADLDAGGHADRFDIFILSDTSDPEVAAQEEALFDTMRAALTGRGRVSYRRRLENTDFKAGNIREWLDASSAGYDFMITLDADSLMGGRLMERMVRAMQRLPRLGILQSLAVGAPAESGFARLFQFGMRHGMRSFTMGSSWWQGDCGPYWGHNAVLRVDAFREHCKLPKLGGVPPWGGPVLSHDQVEAALMRRAGYEVRVAPVEGESWEENPVTLLDFMRREQRWCNGNMQYWPLLGMKGLRPVSRFQLLQAIMMYLGSPAWMVMTALVAAKAAGLDAPSGAPAGGEFATIETASLLEDAAVMSFHLALGIGLFFTMFAMSLAPKLAGVLDVALQRGGVARYGGAGRFSLGVAGEIVFGMLMAPIVALHLTMFLAGMVLGRGAKWSGQVRDAYGLAWRTAVAKVWPQTLFAAGLVAVLIANAPGLLAWGAPVLLGLALAAPFAVLTASPGFGRVLSRFGVASIPDERAPAPILARVLEAEDRLPPPAQGRAAVAV